MQTVWNNLRYAFRQLRRSPGFTFTVVLTLALGVGANAVVFSVLNAIILRPLPVPQAEQLQFFNRLYRAEGNLHPTPSESWPDYRDVRDRNHTFSAIAAYRLVPIGVRYGDRVTKNWIYEITGNYFDMLSVQPALGRFFHPADEHGLNGSPYAVLSNSFWHSRFNGDPAIIGKVIELNKHPFTVLGVAPASFHGSELFLAPDMYTPILNAQQLEVYTSFEARGDHGMWFLGRLKPGVTVPQAEADLHTLTAQLQRQYKEDESLDFRLSKPGLLGELLGGPVHAFLFGVMGLAGLVLLAACANLGSLFAARAADRSRELALRLALGAGRSTLVGQLLAESLLVSLVGGVAGIALALVLVKAIQSFNPVPDFPAVIIVHPDFRLFLFALALSAASGVFFALVPVRGIWQTDAYGVIKSGGVAASGRRWTLRDLLLVLQIVLCSVLVTASLVAVRGLARSLHTDYGFNPAGAVLATFDLKMIGSTDDEAVPLQRRALEAVLALPGVIAAGFANTLPLSVDSSDSSVYRDGTTDLRPSSAVADANYYDISPGYLGAAGTRLLAGRDVSWQDDAKAPKVAVVNEQFVREVFPECNGRLPACAVGRYFLRGGRRQVIGVIEDGKYTTLTEDPKTAMLFPIAQETSAQTTMVVRGHGAALDPGMVDAVRQTLRTLDPAMPVALTSWSQQMGTALYPSIAASAALGVMGVLAAMLAITGIFGMASYSVSKRLRELGIRVALGAQRREVLSAALGRPARLLLFGSMAGIALGAAASKLLAHVVYQASSQDPVVLVGVVAAMFSIALVASWLPARRALSIDPATLLREE